MLVSVTVTPLKEVSPLWPEPALEHGCTGRALPRVWTTQVNSLARTNTSRQANYEAEEDLGQP